MSEQCPRDWTEDFAHENGQYQSICCKCGWRFTGHKRRVICKTCGDSPDPAASKDHDWARSTPEPQRDDERSEAARRDELVRRYACFTMDDGVYEHPQGEHVAYADYEKLRARITTDAATIAAQDERIRELERVNDSIHKLIDDKESALFADNAKLREVVAAADAMWDYGNQPSEQYKAARAKLDQP